MKRRRRKILHPIKLETRPGYRIWLEYDDGVCGELDLSHLVGKGVFKAWEQPGHFEKARITSYGAIAWDENIDLCEYALYMDITGKSAEEVMPGLIPSAQSQDA